MAYKRILTVQDISCVGQCSMTVALPILSACGHETCILPTALLSTHTGGFGKPAVMHNTVVAEMVRHWKENDITFDAILVGYLGSIAAIEQVEMILETMLAPGGMAIVDPAMADHGKLYSGFDAAYAEAMGRLCRKADVILPNITEAAILSGNAYREDLTEEYVRKLLEDLAHPHVILTGAAYRAWETGIALWDEGKIAHHAHRKLGKSFHGTGDMFAAAFTGARMQGQSALEAVETAAEFVCLSIENTLKEPAHWYGVKFETALPALIRKLGL